MVSCPDGPSKTVVVTVNPTPRISPVPSNTFQCNSTLTNITLLSPSTFSSGLINFKFTASATGGVTGFTASASSLSGGFVIADNLINSTTVTQVVTYNITPVSPTGCHDGPAKSVTVTVNPTAVITSLATASWCNNISNSYTATSSSPTATFAWTRAVVAGISNVAGSGASSVITETLHNTTTEPVVVDYLITPSVNGCAGTTFDLAVTVNPTAVITSATTANWCNNISNTYTLPVQAQTATFGWTRAVVAGISNVAASGASSVITETLHNTTTEPVVVHYLITPSVNGLCGCCL